MIIIIRERIVTIDTTSGIAFEMWEWRVFYPSIEHKQLDVWKLLRVHNPPKNTSIRTDIYMVATTKAGLKLRRKKALEVKLIGERHESGAESWRKVSILPV